MRKLPDNFKENPEIVNFPKRNHAFNRSKAPEISARKSNGTEILGMKILGVRQKVVLFPRNSAKLYKLLFLSSKSLEPFCLILFLF